VTSKGTGTDDEIALGGDRDAHLCGELKRRAGLAFAEAVGFGRVPAIQLGLPALDLLAHGLIEDPACFVQRSFQSIQRSLAQRAELAVDLPAQAAHNGALALDGSTHALVLRSLAL
jgi:hypothetical protein